MRYKAYRDYFSSNPRLDVNGQAVQCQVNVFEDSDFLDGTLTAPKRTFRITCKPQSNGGVSLCVGQRKKPMVEVKDMTGLLRYLKRNCGE